MNNAEIKIRLIEESDIPEIARVYADSFNRAETGEHWAEDQALSFVQYWYNTQPDLFFVAVHGHKIIGGAMAEVKQWWNGVGLDHAQLFVDPEFFLNGVGKALLTKLIKEGVDKYSIITFSGMASSHNAFPVSWYKKIAFAPMANWVQLGGKAKEILSKLENGKNQ